MSGRLYLSLFFKSSVLSNRNSARSDIRPQIKNDRHPGRPPQRNGKWIAYRGVDNVSLYLTSLADAAGRPLIMDPSGVNALTGIVWSPDGKWPGLSLISASGQDSQVILLDPDRCEIYSIRGLTGELNGTLLP